MKESEDKVNNNVKETEEKTKKFFQDNKSLFMVIGIIVLLLIIVRFMYPSNKNNKVNIDNNSYNKIYGVKIHIDFTANIIFSKYDVIISVGNQEKRLYHGENADVQFYLESGSYTVKFENAEDSSIKTERELNVNDNNVEIGYKISCHNDRIDVEQLYIDEDVELQENEIKMTTDKSAFVDKNYKDVITELGNIGFTNIIEKPLYDIELGFTTEGEVENVTIDSKEDYSRGDVFQKDAEVIVSYHLKSQDDPEKIPIPYTWISAKDMNYKEVEQAFKDAGFNHVVSLSLETSAKKSNENKVYDIKINDETASSDKKYKPDDNVVIYYYEYEPRVSETKLEKYYAHKAFEEYGKQKYKYGFKCHWIVGILDEKENSDGSFYFKVEVTITNAYGADYDAVAEATVSGSNANPKVTNFIVK